MNKIIKLFIIKSFIFFTININNAIISEEEIELKKIEIQKKASVKRKNIYYPLLQRVTKCLLSEYSDTWKFKSNTIKNKIYHLLQKKKRPSYIRKKINQDFKKVLKQSLDCSNMFFENLNLSELYLPYACFDGAILINVKFDKSNLKSCSFKKAILLNIDFKETKLEKTNFQDAELVNVNLEGGNLKESNLTNTKLHRVNLKNTALQGATLNYFCKLPQYSSEQGLKSFLMRLNEEQRNEIINLFFKNTHRNIESDDSNLIPEDGGPS